MSLYESEFLEIKLDDTKKIIINKWLPSTEKMKDEQYKADMLKFVDLVKVHKPTFHLIDSVKFLYIISVEMQEWTNNSVFPLLIENGIKKIAFLVSSEMIANLSIEQTLDESNATFQTKYFDVEKEAMEWLK